MPVEEVRAYFTKINMGDRVTEFPVSSATVQLAALAAGVEPARIAKTLSFSGVEGGCLLVVAAGDAKINNRKFRDAFGFKARMLPSEDTLRMTGHAVGGVCPFALPEGVSVYLDISMKRFDTVFPAAGSSNSAVELSCDELYEHSGALGWVDVCTLPGEE